MQRMLLVLDRGTNELESIPVTMFRTREGLLLNCEKGKITFMPSRGYALLAGRQIPAVINRRICEIALD